MADIPDIDLSSLGVTTFGSFTVEVIDPVPDYLELLEVPAYLALVLQLLVCRSSRMLIVNCHIGTQVLIYIISCGLKSANLTLLSLM